MKLPLFRSMAVATFAVGWCVASAAAAGKISLSDGPRMRDLQVSLVVPEGWTVQWYSARDSHGVARIYRDESQGKEAIIIVATPLSEKQRGKSTDEILDETFLGALAKGLGAYTQRRVKNDFWDGAYFEYETKAPSPAFKIEAHNWMLVADQYIVQFQCYFLSERGAPPEEHKAAEQSLAARYREILLSIEK